MFKLCHFLNDDNKICNAAAMRGQIYCYHHLELLRRERYKARSRRRLMDSILKATPPNDLPAVQRAIERIQDAITLGRVEKEQAQVLVSALRSMARNLRHWPKGLREPPSSWPKARSCPSGRLEGGM